MNHLGQALDGLVDPVFRNNCLDLPCFSGWGGGVISTANREEGEIC